MMKTLVFKEFLSHLRSFKFYPLTAILIVLFIINGVWFSHQYEAHQAYFKRNLNNEKWPASRQYQIPPDPGMFCCANNEKLLTSFCAIFLHVMQFGHHFKVSKGNMYAPLVQALDWIFIVQILFSLLVILLAYNAISEETEEKTLTLVASNSVSRWQIFLSKFLSILLIAASALLISILSGLITILIINKIPLQAEMIGRIFLFFISSLIYGSLFIFIGLGCSILTRRSTLSLLMAITVWLLFVIILPESVGTAVKRTQIRPSDYELTGQLNELVNYGLRKKNEELRQEILANAPYTEEEKQKMIADTEKEIANNVEKNKIQRRQLADYILQLKVNRYLEQQRWQSISPAILFRQITETLMFGGNYRFLDFIEQLRLFTFQFYSYYDKLGVQDFMWMGIAVQINNENIYISPPRKRAEYNHMEFELRPPSIGKSIVNALKSLVFLFTMLVGVGVWGFVRFVRCDIR